MTLAHAQELTLYAARGSSLPRRGTPSHAQLPSLQMTWTQSQNCVKLSYFPKPTTLATLYETWVMEVCLQVLLTKRATIQPCKFCVMHLACNGSIRAPSFYVPPTFSNCEQGGVNITKIEHPINTLFLQSFYDYTSLLEPSANALPPQIVRLGRFMP